MSYLLAIAVGPVQEFIAAARRTRDLWFGSQLLSDISRAVAKAVETAGGELIFPASLDAKNVANVILAELPANEPQAVAVQAKQAARQHWRKVTEGAREGASGVIRPEVWNSQVDDVIEFYAAWLPASDDYSQDRRQLMRLLSGRKNCRDFLPADGVPGLPKSSLDGQRETVLRPYAEWQQRFRARLRIRDGEQLDVVGLVKRLSGGRATYPSVSRIAADPWVRGNLPRLAEVASACEVLHREGMLHQIDTKKHPQFQDFPYEGTAVYITRHHELLEETVEPQERSRDWLRALREALGRLPEPNHYLAVLVADGDRMGAAISVLKTAGENRNFSKILTGFAKDAEDIVNQHQGVLVYAGGDDVLAFLPVDKCLECARELHDRFGGLLKHYKNDKGEPPTLSVGIAIGHFMENLEDLLEYGRAAEKAAKKVEGKDALAVHLHKRGGSPVKVSLPWKEEPDNALTRYAELMLTEAIPGKLPYELRNLAKLYSNKHWSGEALAEAIQKDVLRVIRDKQPRGGKKYMEEIEERLSGHVKNSAELLRFSEELLVARQLATAMQQAGVRPEKKETT